MAAPDTLAPANRAAGRSTASTPPQGRPNVRQRVTRMANFRILVIDDVAPVRDLWRELLSMAGYEVAATSEPAEGLALFDVRPHDLVITDLVMPGIDGWGVVESVRRRKPAVPVIIASGSATDRDLERASREGIPLLVKPVDLARLRATVQTQLATGTTEGTVAPGAS